jgi:hypothetical protein
VFTTIGPIGMVRSLSDMQLAAFEVYILPAQTAKL